MFHSSVNILQTVDETSNLASNSKFLLNLKNYFSSSELGVGTIEKESKWLPKLLITSVRIESIMENSHFM